MHNGSVVSLKPSSPANLGANISLTLHGTSSCTGKAYNGRPPQPKGEATSHVREGGGGSSALLLAPTLAGNLFCAALMPPWAETLAEGRAGKESKG
jgi:hypothetical protein